MSRPGRLLLSLVILAGIAGYFLKHTHDENLRRPSAPDTASVEPSEEPPSSGTPEAPTTPATTAPPPPLSQVGESQVEIEGKLLNEAYQISKTRSLSFQDALKFQPGTETTLQKAWRRQIDQRFPGDSLDRMGLTLQVLGILPADEDLTARYRLFPNLSAAVLYDGLDDHLLHVETLNPEAPEAREWVALHLALMLLDQNFHWREQVAPIEANMDQAIAQQAFVVGDAFLHAAKHTETDIATSQAWTRLDQLTNNWPAPLRDAEFLPLREGVHFCQSVSGQNVALDSIYQQLPSTTAHLLHPDRYLEVPRWKPRQVEWERLDVQRSEPLWDNVIGELMVRALLQRVLDPEDAALFAASWEGDGVLLYQTKDDAPQLVWKTAWRNAGAARRFFATLGGEANRLFDLQGPGERSGDRWTFEGILNLSLTVQDDTVTLTRATDPSWHTALNELARQSPLVSP